MSTKYKSLDGTWKDFVIKTGTKDEETYHLLMELQEKIEELEFLIGGLAAFAGVSE